MALKTDYKDDSYEGKRKYLLIDNGDGTYSLDDVTVYKVIGDFFNGHDINATNSEVNKNTQGLLEERNTTNKQIDDTNKKVDSVDKKADALKTVRYATFSASKWSTNAPYSQTVNVVGLESTDNPVISLNISSSVNAATAKSQSESYGYVDRGVTGNGTLTLYCYNLKPSVDFQVAIKGE